MDDRVSYVRADSSQGPIPDLITPADIRYWRAVEAMVQELLEVLDSEGAHRMWAVLSRLRAVVGEREREEES